MILNDFVVLTTTGLYCSYGKFYLDPKEMVRDAVISHAHGDHAVSGNQNVYCTKPTSLFMLHRYKKFAAGEFHLIDFNESFTLNDVKITFLSAGHMLGSAMVLMEYKGVSYLYTGDYKLQPDPTCEPIVFPMADVLITETTFADPEVLHPDPEQEIRKLSTTTGNIMLGAYALGKSQRLIRMINDFCPEKRILVHHNIIPFVRIYEQEGFSLGNYEVYDRKVMKNNQENLIYLVPPLVFRSYIRAVNVIRVFASGWKNLQRSNGMELLISDHVDWNDIIYTIDQIKPSEVWTIHGNGSQLQDYYVNNLIVKLLN
ncbi:exonuclease [Pedobacter antarcticus 4BY]|uniref:Exonuclease n=2 Tax=Pedobacter antarcticus TaxID=34086 RepID=A0A081PJ68_9SPHI|nr:MBL fold metallo-hydrolase [Pedobacter antarcticus]KEQ30741.1 exonuclease [Pedobacter antarcticus 4BY]SFE91509.1 putative mRNA 3-end processing factor [Pedobacter antarcticus]